MTQTGDDQEFKSLSSTPSPQHAEQDPGDGRTMKAVTLPSYGPPEALRYGDIVIPDPLPDQVLIQIRAAGVNPIDWRIRSGSLRLFLPARFPIVLGFDVSGVVVAVGADVELWKPGDEVIAYLDNAHGGGYAEYSVASQHVVARKPVSVPHVEAASLPLAGSTALQALRNHGKIATGARVLINGASGGVGTFAVQLSNFFGASVTAVCGPSNVDFVSELGADEVIDYTQQDFTRMEARFDIIFDAVAKKSFLACRNVLSPRGRFITTVPSLTNVVYEAATRLGGRRYCKNMLATKCGSDLQYLSGLIDDGSLRPIVTEILPLMQAAHAHRLSESHRTRGKIVLRM